VEVEEVVVRAEVRVKVGVRVDVRVDVSCRLQVPTRRERMARARPSASWPWSS
jgi:hypothetical protein